MPGGYGTSGPWGEAGTTSTPGGNQGGPRHPGGYNPNLNPPVTVDYTSPVVDTRGDGQVTGITSVDDMIEDPITVDTMPVKSTNPTEFDDEIWNLAVQAADPITNPGYALSYEGKELIKQGIQPGSDTWIKTFGLPQIIGTTSKAYDEHGQIIGLGDPVTTGIRYGGTDTDYRDEYGQIIEGGKPIMTGQGKYLMDQYDDSKTYEENIDAYYKMREAEQAQQTDGDPNYGYGYSYDPGSYTVSGGYGYGYGGDPNYIGKTPFDYGDPYSEARYAPLEQHERMVDVNTPRYAARGGIMNLRR